MATQLKTLLLALAISGSSAALADDEELNALQQKISSGNAQAAWQQAQDMRAGWESDTRFDYLYGLLAFERGEFHEAQFALERVVVAEPGNIRARLALAKSYYKLGDQHSARRQLEAVRDSNPPAHVRRDVNHYLTRLEGGRTGSFSGYIEAGIGHDNNVNLATGTGSITNPLFDPLDPTSDPFILVSRNARQQSDMYDFLRIGADYYQPLNETTGVELRGRLGSHNNFSSDRYDNTLYRGSASLVHVTGKDQWRGTITAQDNRLSDSDYQQYYSLSGDWTRYNFGGWTYSAAVFFNELRYDEDSVRNIYQYIGNVAAQRQLGAFSHTIGLTLGDEDAQRAAGDHNARQFAGLYYDLWYDLSGGHQLFGRAYVQDAHQHGEDPFFRQVRDDSFHQLTLGWDWHINKPLRLRTEVMYSDNDSDVDYYSYDRTRIQTGLRYSF